ncbi:MAG TPA: DUF3291 domain-containing protein [Pyrinomonadaceae bacterium]|nr:DUF3291 domain-containing protein [Pyrinomonadaceae bacterium]
MQAVRYHLAEINIARLRAPLDDPSMADFVAQLDPVNAIADESVGFVWRLKAEGGEASSYVRAFDDERILINMSVWESVEALQQYVYRSMHAGVFLDRKKWFEKLEGPPLAMWWVPAGYTPTIAEGVERLKTLARLGPSRAAFTFKAQFPPPQKPYEQDELLRANPTQMTEPCGMDR